MNKRKSNAAYLASAAILFLLRSTFAGQPAFLGLGGLPGNDCSSFQSVADMSRDGLVVIGACSELISPGNVISDRFIWTAASGMSRIDNLPNWPMDAHALRLSENGSTILGRDTNGLFLWSANTGAQQLGFDESRPLLSADGEVVVGSRSTPTGRELYQWTSSNGLVGLGDYISETGQGTGGDVLSVSADGSVISSFSHAFGEGTAHRWTADTGYAEQYSWGPPDLTRPYGASAASEDGSVFAGIAFVDDEPGFTYRWTAALGVEYFEIPNTIFSSDPLLVSGDGSTVIGMAQTTEHFEPFVWTANDGARLLRDIITNDLNADLSDWSSLWEPKDISSDGRTIVGVGTDTEGFELTWIVTIPEPNTVFLFAFGIIVINRRRRREFSDKTRMN